MKTKTNALNTLFIWCFLFFGLTIGAEEHPAFTGWKQAETNHFRFIFEEASRQQTIELAGKADNIWNQVAEIYSPPPVKTDVIMTARTDITNAFAEGLNFFMGFYTNAPITPEFGFRSDWSTMVFTHELVHIANFKFEGKKNKLADIFGPFWNITDFVGRPGWQIEGLTTVLETELTEGGRGRSPFFELLFKAPTLENSFLDYEEIGTEAEPPRGQIYVMGYIMMRSIADRWGMSTLANLERNRSTERNFEKTVEFLTGERAENIFRDARISLNKRYANERKIPEGIPVTPVEKNSYYYKPALVSNTEIITLRSKQKEDTAAVSWNPQTKEETILFEASFADSDSLTAADNGLIIAALQTTLNEKLPGITINTDLWTWKKSVGLTKLTNGVSLFQPSLSRSGNKLVAVEQIGFRYRLVEVDLNTGNCKTLLESNSHSFIQPSLSDDGSFVSFLMLDGKRAVLATALMPAYEFAYPIPQKNITKIDNITDHIYDIAYPTWQRDGSIFFASNERGRLEVWQWSEGKKRPVVSDPIGAFWAEKTDKGILYASYASTGNLLKMKPLDQWAVVPDFLGPSLPGEIMRFGNLSSDFPSFSPFSVAEKKETEEEKEKILERIIPYTPTEVTTTISNEKKFIPLPRLQFWLPAFDMIPVENEESIFGLGGCVYLSSYPLQGGSQSNFLFADALYYPTIGQAKADVFFSQTLAGAQLFFLISRNLGFVDGTNFFKETNTALLSFSIPLINKSFHRETMDIALTTGFQTQAQRQQEIVFSVINDNPFTSSFTTHLGVDGYYSHSPLKEFSITARANATLFVSIMPTSSNKVFFGNDFQISSTAGTRQVQGELGIKSRWFNYPQEMPLPLTLVSKKAETLDSSYPGRTLIQAALVIPKGFNTRFFIEKLISSGKNTHGIPTPENNTFLNIVVDPWWDFGGEIEIEQGRTRIAMGVLSSLKKADIERVLPNTRFYFTFKIDAFQSTSSF
ncbi:MAG TPA: hypothetical protein VJ861_12520 [Treponemataceae bacterium]|nr:hypothetical protein [Treponemataceae bacterium]